ncbi:MAG TPA: hypothetical protein VF268_07865 [Gammaproteobacteria bacterium]
MSADKDVHIWVLNDAEKRRYWRQVLSRLLAEETSAHPGMASAEMFTRVVPMKKLTLICLSRGQRIGVGMGKVLRLPELLNRVAPMLDSQTLAGIRANPPEQRQRIISLLYYQRVALAQALDLKGPYRLWRVNPMFIRGDCGMGLNDGCRIVGGFMLKTLSLGADYTSVLCCSPLTRRVVVGSL